MISIVLLLPFFLNKWYCMHCLYNVVIVVVVENKCQFNIRIASKTFHCIAPDPGSFEAIFGVPSRIRPERMITNILTEQYFNKTLLKLTAQLCIKQEGVGSAMVYDMWIIT